MVEIAPECIELLVPETFVLSDPAGGGLHGLGVQLTTNHPPFLGALDQAGRLQHGKVFHEPGKRHAVGFGQLADGGGASAQPFKHGTPCRVGQRGKNEVELLIHIVNHMV